MTTIVLNYPVRLWISTMLLHKKFDTLNEYHAALDRVIQRAEKNLNIFDFNLADSGYNSPQRFQLLRDFLLAGRTNRLVIILYETDYLVKYCPRIMSLLAQFSYAIDLRQTCEQAKQISDTFVLADNRHYVHRFHYDHPKCQLALDDIQGCASFVQRFNELEKASDAALPPTTLGL